MTDTATPQRSGMDRRAMLLGAATASVAGLLAKSDPALALVSTMPDREKLMDAMPYGVGSPF